MEGNLTDQTTLLTAPAQKYNFNNNRNFYQPSGLLHYLSNLSLNQSTKIPYQNFVEEYYHGVFSSNPLLHLSSKNTDQQKPQKSGSKFYRKLLKWKKALSKPQTSTVTSASSKKPKKSLGLCDTPTKRLSLKVSSLKRKQTSRQSCIEAEGLNLSLVSVLHCKDSRNRFRSFLKQEYSEENIDFWLDAEKFKNKPTRSEAIKICSTYIGDSAPKEINLTHKARAEVNKNLEMKYFSADFFDNAQLEIFKLMQKDSFIRFKAAITRN